MRSSLTRRSGI
jgi:hypothetical protein